MIKILFTFILTLVNGNFGEWTSFLECNSTCGDGVQFRTRRCDNPPPAFGGEKCVGVYNESKSCMNNTPCPGNTLNYLMIITPLIIKVIYNDCSTCFHDVNTFFLHSNISKWEFW